MPAVALELDAAFASPADLVAAYDAELSRKGLLVRGATVERASPMTPCLVRLHVEGVLLLELQATLAAVVPGDVIVTGTPTGAGARFDPPIWLKPGDVIEVEAEGIGKLVNGVTDEAVSG